MLNNDNNKERMNLGKSPGNEGFEKGWLYGWDISNISWGTGTSNNDEL